MIILLFADFQVLISYTEDYLQKAVHKLIQITKYYNLKISTQNSKVMAFNDRDRISSKHYK